MSNALHTSRQASRNQAGRHHATTPECAGHARAHALLVAVIGDEPSDLVWDGSHPLQGHFHVGSHELVVIAPRDGAHEPVVLTALTWDAVRHSSNDERRALIETGSITDHDHLVTAMAARDLLVAA